LDCGFFADFSRPTRFAEDEGPFAADERFAFFGGVRRDFAAAGFLRFRVAFFPDFDLDLEAIRDSRVQSRRGLPGKRAFTPVFDG
jgi:hypothetical protein